MLDTRQDVSVLVGRSNSFIEEIGGTSGFEVEKRQRSSTQTVTQNENPPAM